MFKIVSVLLLTLSFSLFAETITVTMVRGTVTVDGNIIKANQTLEEGKEINASGPQSAVQLRFSDGSRFLLKDGTMTVKPQAATEKDTTIVDLAKGILFASKAKSNRSLKVQTKNAAMGVRGTKFYVEEKAEETYLCVCEGSVEIKNEKATQVVNKDEDAHVSIGKIFEKTKAKQMMTDMAWSGFQEMGFKKNP